ncbi:hypothetical protein DM01DRAFT_1332568 [Hesseltinella vesiculosa]|uniref:Transcription factor domain-containing protein n=1 Tax=Hesseltinella vesiculosa TaxID=101127 RepID=A0A1X2GS86_9FUNG|nr:hypothetical protein DM01DRAFT_1332568 [Hesseltinella vesiculosa]
MPSLWSYDHNITTQPQRKFSTTTITSPTPTPSPVQLPTPLETDDNASTISSLSTSTAVTPTSNFLLPLSTQRLQEWLNRSCSLIHTNNGLILEARIANATEFRSLVDAFQSLCQIDPAAATASSAGNPSSHTDTSVTLYRNKLHKAKPVNFFLSLCDPGVLTMTTHSIVSQLALRHIMDACVDSFFTCWVRYSSLINKAAFMAWYRSSPHAMDSPIVNAICAQAFSHTVYHHAKPGFEHFRKDTNLILEQQAFFFDRARDSLAASFDRPDRYTIVALTLMGCMANPERRHHYSGLAASALLDLDIYPRMEDDKEEDDTYEKELDTRLWWYVWSMDFYLFSTGVPRNSPKTRREGTPAYPQVREEDIDDVEHSVLMDTYCHRLWKFQEEVLDAFYNHEDQVTTAQQLRHFDNKLLEVYQDLPRYLQLDSGFEYGCAELFLVCVRVNVEFNATRLILHIPFLPDANVAQPSELALQSLHVCLKTALLQLRITHTISRFGGIFRCAFDRDEFWRACEILSLALDVYRGCDATHRHLILDGLQPVDLTASLHKAKSILHSSVEFTIGSKNWLTVNDWLNNEIARHERLDHASPVPPSSYLQNDCFHPIFKSPDTSHLASPVPSPSSVPAQLSCHPSSPEPLSISTTFIQNDIPAPTYIVASQQPSASCSSSPPKRPSYSQPSPAPSSSSEFIAFCPEDEFVVTSPTKQKPGRRGSTKQPRFRYFNPRKLNKLLFIDDHPIV